MMIDPYLDPQSGILLNKFGLTDRESIDRADYSLGETGAVAVNEWKVLKIKMPHPAA